MSAARTGDDTFPRLLEAHAAQRGDGPALREKRRGIWRTVTWAQFAREASEIAAGLAGRGLKRGAHVAFLGENRPRLFAGIAAAQALGAVAVPLFPDARADEILEPLRRAGVTHVFAQNQEQVDKLLEILPRLPAIRCVVFDDDRSMSHYKQPQLIHYDVLRDEGAAGVARDPELVAREIALGAGEDPAFLFQTSGATGPAKPVVLSHAALIGRARAAARAEGVGPGDVTLAYLPPAWICQALFGYAQPLAAGYCVACPESSDTLLADMREIAPTVFVTTPRMLDTIVSQVTLRMEDSGGSALRLFRNGVTLAEELGRMELAGRRPAFGDRVRAGLYDVLVYGPLRDSLGMSRVKVAYCAGDALDPSVLGFFRAQGVNLKQLYGATEAAYLVATPPTGRVKPDTVGEPFDGVEVKLSPESEVLVRSPDLFSGYLDDAEATAAAMADGWFRTGDVGRFDDDGQLVIEDRAADIGALAGGARYAPRPIENKIKFSPYVREAVVVGHGRESVCALIDINTSAVGRWADGHDIPFSGHADLASREEIYEMVAGILASVNADLAADPASAPCQIRRFALLPEELNADDGVLTRTGKIRRPVVAERFAPVIEAFYSGGSAASLDGVAEAGGFGEGGPTVIKIREARAASGGASRRAA